jgi:ankyrin repeat protein
MRPELVALIDRLAQSDRYEGLSLDNINATDSDGDNALHSAVVGNDLDEARLLIEAGINIDQHGDLGYTPLHNACSFGHKDMVLLLIESGADVYALCEGETPFGLARIRGHVEIRELMRAAMRQKQGQDPHRVIKLRIGLLRREIARLERQMESEDQETPPD